MQNDLVSIIIPVYNGEKYIEDCIKNLKEQTYRSFEAIFVNDGSKDNSLELLQKFTSGDPRMHVYSKENGGASSARNYGLKLAQGKYIGFIDVDDYIYPIYIEYLYMLITKYDTDMSCCGYYKMWDSEIFPEFSNNDEIIQMNSVVAMKHLLYRRYITGYPVLKLYDANIIRGIRFPTDIAYGEDAIFTVEALQNCNRIVYGSRILYIYYQHVNSSSHIVDYKKYRASWDIHKEKILNGTYILNNGLEAPARAKCFILATDYICRIWKSKEEEICYLKKELFSYMKSVDTQVLKDKNCKKLNRILAFMCCISANGMIYACRLYNWFKRKIGFETRQSV